MYEEVKCGTYDNLDLAEAGLIAIEFSKSVVLNHGYTIKSSGELFFFNIPIPSQLLYSPG